jgi:hypothetical protein
LNVNHRQKQGSFDWNILALMLSVSVILPNQGPFFRTYIEKRKSEFPYRYLFTQMKSERERKTAINSEILQLN